MYSDTEVELELEEELRTYALHLRGLDEADFEEARRKLEVECDRPLTPNLAQYVADKKAVFKGVAEERPIEPIKPIKPIGEVMEASSSSPQAARFFEIPTWQRKGGLYCPVNRAAYRKKNN